MLAVGAAGVAMIVGSVFAGIGLKMVSSGTLDPIQAPANTTETTIASAIPIQIGFVFAAVVFAFMTTRQPARSLNLQAPSVRLPSALVLVGSGLFVWFLTSLAFAGLLTFFEQEASEQLESLTESVTTPNSAAQAALLLLAVGVLPGIGEEVLMRGYILTQARKALRPSLAILFTSIIFALFHGDPQHMVMIFPLGLWWTWIAVRTRSVILPIIMHAMNNSWSIVYSWIAANSSDESSGSIDRALMIAILLSGLCFLASLVILARPPAKDQSSKQPLPENQP